MGWAKRGPSGVIGTNKSDAADVIKLLVEDLKAPKQTGDITEVLPAGYPVIDQTAWERINLREVEAGEPLGKPRVKGTSIHSLLEYSKL